MMGCSAATAAAAEQRHIVITTIKSVVHDPFPAL